MNDQITKAMNIADMHDAELQHVAQIVHKALGWDMIPEDQAIYSRDMVNELALCYEKIQIDEIRQRVELIVFNSFIERYNLQTLLNQYIEDGRPKQ